MRTNKGGIIALTALMSIGASGIWAQAATEQDAPPALRRGVDVERIMSLRERLELTEDQVAALEEIRREAVQRRTVEMAEALEMRSRVRAGQIRQSEMMAFMEERRDANQGVAEQRRERIEGVLDEAQLETLQTLRMRGAYLRGRADMRRRRGPALGPNGGRGAPGRGFRGQRGPRDGFGRDLRGQRRFDGVPRAPSGRPLP
jgi:hypothetical protein